MVLAIAFVIGAAIGWQRAAHRGGDRLDRLQYSAAHGIAFTLLTLAAMILAGRLGLV